MSTSLPTAAPIVGPPPTFLRSGRDPSQICPASGLYLSMTINLPMTSARRVIRVRVDREQDGMAFGGTREIIMPMSSWQNDSMAGGEDGRER